MLCNADMEWWQAMNTLANGTSAHNSPRIPEAGYRPVTEETDISAPRVTGRIPHGLTGTLLRIGANPLGPVDPARHNTLTGDAMVHGLHITDGRAEWYRNRWVRTDKVARALGELPTPGPRHGLSDNANANIVHHAGRTYAVGDGGILPVELAADLSTLARSDFGGTLPAGFSAHPETDPVTGELHAIAYNHALPHMHYLVVGTDGLVRKAEPITTKSTSMMHTFSLTDRYAVIYDLPVTFNPTAAATGSRLPYTWDEGHGARLGVLPRNGTDADILWMEIDPCYVFHTLNAYETGDQIILDVIRHQRVFDQDRLSPSESVPTLWRWTLDLTCGTVTETQLDDQPQEFPRIDDRYKGSEHRYGFTTALRADQPAALAGPALLRHDLHTGQTQVHEYGPGREAGEAVFVPRTPDAPEADGYLITPVYDHATDTTDIVIIDTDDFTGTPVATIHLSVRIPHGFHTTWITQY
jgi:carotenoid cleavage dioxygenase-like enzyme